MVFFLLSGHEHGDVGHTPPLTVTQGRCRRGSQWIREGWGPGDEDAKKEPSLDKVVL